MAAAGCVFCDVVAGVRPASFVHADAECVAFLDIHPITPGHLLVAPRAHALRVGELTPATRARLFDLGGELADRLRARLPCDDVHFLLNDGPGAWQTVPHVHLHVIPRRRRPSDTARVVLELLARPLAPLRRPADRAALDALAASLRMAAVA